MSPYVSTTAIVINKSKSKEADIFVTLLTPQLGKITALAKGAQSIKSSRLSALQLGNIVKVCLYQKNNFNWLSQARTLTPFMQTPKNLVQVGLLFYLLEIINRSLAENQTLDNVYPICQNIITAINKNQTSVYLKNEIALISSLGFGLPAEINQAFAQKNYRQTQQYIQKFFESIIEQPLESPKLFR
jgi:DNA repair protein RecO (recombination protein O)